MPQAFAGGEADLSNEFARVFFVRVDGSFPVTTIPRHVLFTSWKKTCTVYNNLQVQVLLS
jgi:hypothetical protein